MCDDMCQCLQLMLLLVHSSHWKWKVRRTALWDTVSPAANGQCIRAFMHTETSSVHHMCRKCFSEHLNDDFVFHTCSVPVATVINSSCAHVHVSLLCSCLSFFISVCPSGRKESPLFSSWRGKERHPSHSTQPRLWRTDRALLSLCSAMFPLRKTGTWGLQGGEDRNPYPERRERMFTLPLLFLTTSAATFPQRRILIFLYL